jgi:hypothetical protein
MVYTKTTCFLMCLGLFGLLSSEATFARYSTILDAGYGSEPDLYEVLDVVAPIPGGWMSTTALNTNVTGLRIDDDADQLWQSGSFKATVITTFWGGTAAPSDTAEQFFRYDDNVDGSSPVELTDIDDPGETAGFTVSDGPFVIGSGGGIYGAWSNEALNSGPLSDRAVTFNVQGLDIYTWMAGDKSNPTTSLLLSSVHLPAYIVAFETGLDGDYQDMLVLVESIRPIPAPRAVVLGSIGLLFVGWLRRK